MHSKLSESELRLEESWQDILGLDGYDIAVEQMGSVEDLYIDREACQPCFLVVQEKPGNEGDTESLRGRFAWRRRKRFAWRRRKRRTGRGEALRQTLSALGSVRRHTRGVAGSGTAFLRHLLAWPTPLRQLLVQAAVPIWITCTFIGQPPLCVAFHRLLGNQAATQQSREHLMTGWRNA